MEKFNRVDNGCIGICPGENLPNAAILLAHSNCSNYCHCNQKKAIVKNCDSNLRFNSRDGICDRPEKVECHVRGTDDFGLDNSAGSESEENNFIIIYCLISIIWLIGIVFIIIFGCNHTKKFRFNFWRSN